MYNRPVMYFDKLELLDEDEYPGLFLMSDELGSA